MATGGIPWYIDENAVHSPSVARMVAYIATRGQQGILDVSHLRVSAQLTPSAAVDIAPGAFSVLNTASGLSSECYLGKFDTTQTVSVSPTGASGRTDLVILRVENPYGGGTGTGGPWSIPADPVHDPYWYPRVIEGVTPQYIQDVRTWNSTWAAIPLARIVRPANTGIVQASHITDLRSLIDLSHGERIITVNNPPPDPPPVANAVWSDSQHCSTATTFSYGTTAWTNWPTAVNFSVPVPSWAQEADIVGSFNPQFDNDVWGEFRFTFDGDGGPAIMFDYNVSWGQTSPGPQQMTANLGGTWTIPQAKRGKVVTVRLQAHMLDPSNHHGNLATRNGVYCNLLLNFKRYPN